MSLHGEKPSVPAVLSRCEGPSGPHFPPLWCTGSTFLLGLFSSAWISSLLQTSRQPSNTFLSCLTAVDFYCSQPRTLTAVHPQLSHWILESTKNRRRWMQFNASNTSLRQIFLLSDTTSYWPTPFCKIFFLILKATFVHGSTLEHVTITMKILITPNLIKPEITYYISYKLSS